MENVVRLIKQAVTRVMSQNKKEITDSLHLVAHPLVKGIPKIGLVSQKPIDRAERLPIAQRLIKSYTLAMKDESFAKLQLPQNDLWTHLIDTEFKELLYILKSEDAVALSKYLLHFGEKFTWFGGLTLSVDGFNQQRNPSAIALSYLDKLVCLAESLGVLSLENPEYSPQWGKNLYVDVNELLDSIEKMIGISVAPPGGAVPVMGIDTKRGPLHYRHFNSLYAALRIKELLPEKGPICEYGGGLGIVAYYASKLGFSDYTIFDLPLINVFAGHFLMNTLGAESVRLYGEDSQAAAVHILPYWECMVIPSEIYSLALNQDSFPEIDPILVLEYLRQIERTTQKYFLSINQEAQAPMASRRQNSVPALIQDFEAFHRVYRMKYWIREGYVEELYELRH